MQEYKYLNKTYYKYGNNTYPMTKTSETFNDIFWYCDTYDDAVRDCVTILFQYYWVEMNWKEKWYNNNFVLISDREKHVDDDDAFGTISLLFMEKIIVFDPTRTSCTPWMWAKMMMEQHFSQKLAKLTSFKAPHRQTIKKYNYQMEYDIVSEDIDNFDIPYEENEDSELLDNVLEYLKNLPHGDLVLARYGFDRGYKRTAKELADELGMTPKTINYWCAKNLNKCRKKFAAA